MTAARTSLSRREHARRMWFPAREWLLALYSWLWFAVTAWLGEVQVYVGYVARAWLYGLKTSERARRAGDTAGWTIRSVPALAASTRHLHVRRRARRVRHQLGPAAPWLIAIVLVVGCSLLVTHGLG